MDSSSWNRSTTRVAAIARRASLTNFASKSPPEWRSLTVACLYTLLTSTGTIAGEIELDQPASPGGYIRIPEGQRMRILGVIPVERIEEIVGSRPSHGIILVAPVA